MTSNEASEVMSIIRRVGPVVLSTATVSAGITAAILRRMVGVMMLDANMIYLQLFGTVFGACLDLARFCGATLATMDRVRKAALAETPVGLPAEQAVLCIVRLTLACEARILSFMQFSSRDQVEEIATAMNAAFAQASEVAADDLLAGVYVALISLHGTVVQYLAARGRLLPRVVAYDYPAVMPALRMAQQAYADPSRYLQLIAENGVVHPAFMPRAGKMLAV